MSGERGAMSDESLKFKVEGLTMSGELCYPPPPPFGVLPPVSGGESGWGAINVDLRSLMSVGE